MSWRFLTSILLNRRVKESARYVQSRVGAAPRCPVCRAEAVWCRLCDAWVCVGSGCGEVFK